MNATLLIMAAGMGSRYGGLKQIDTFGPSGETILEYSIYDAIQAGFTKVVLVIRESFFDDFKRVLGEKFHKHIEVVYVFQEINPIVPGVKLPERQKPWGTGHAVLSAKETIDQPFCVINADDWYGRDPFDKMYDYLTNDLHASTCAMVGYTLKNTLSKHGTVNRGVCMVDQDNKLLNIQEHLKIGYRDGILCDEEGVVLDSNITVSMNFRGFHPDIMNVFEEQFHIFLQTYKDVPKAEFFITTPPNLFVQGPDTSCHVLLSDALWYGVTYTEDKPYVEQAIKHLVEKGDYPSSLWTV